MYGYISLSLGHKITAYAEEDPLEDEVEIEGEGDVEEVASTDEEEEEERTTASPDADTTLLFVRPIATASQLGWLLLTCCWFCEFVIKK